MPTPSETMWNNFIQENQIQNANYQTRWFGQQDRPDTIDQMNHLILSGQKRATSSPLAYYAAEQEAVPQVGDYYILLDGQMKPVAIIQTVVSELIPFLRVSAEHAYNEGEGDLSLTNWRERALHTFEEMMQRYDAHFSNDDPVVTEMFKVVYKP